MFSRNALYKSTFYVLTYLLVPGLEDRPGCSRLPSTTGQDYEGNEDDDGKTQLHSQPDGEPVEVCRPITVFLVINCTTAVVYGTPGCSRK